MVLYYISSKNRRTFRETRMLVIMLITGKNITLNSLPLDDGRTMNGSHSVLSTNYNVFVVTRGLANLCVCSKIYMNWRRCQPCIVDEAYIGR